MTYLSVISIITVEKGLARINRQRWDTSHPPPIVSSLKVSFGQNVAARFHFCSGSSMFPIIYISIQSRRFQGAEGVLSTKL